VGVDLHRGTILLDLAGVKQDNPVSQCKSLLLVVGDIDCRNTRLVQELA